MAPLMGTVRDAVVGLLRDAGMTTIFGNPGSTELPLFKNFPDDFRYVLGLQESVVVGMADGFAQATGNAAVVNLHSAAGVGHAMGNIFTAYRNRTPLVITAGQQARSILPYEAFLSATDATMLPQPYVKWSCEPARGEDVPGAIARAYDIAMQQPCGPTFVSIPVDDWERACDPVRPRTVSRLRFPDPTFVDTFAARLNRSERPVFVVGPGVDRNGAWESVVALAERHQALVWASPMSPRSGFPERHPLFAGFLPAIRERIVERLTGHDLVFALGAPVFTYHIEGFGPHVPPGAELLQMVDDPDVAARTPGGTVLVSDVRLGTEALLQRPAPASRPVPHGRCAPARVDPGERITPAFLMQTLADVRPPDSILVEESPSTRSTMQTYLPIERPHSFFTCASGGLGHSLPAGVGVALATGAARKVIGLFGDGSSMYSIQALWSAADLELPITVIVVNNGGYAALSEFLSHFNLKEPIGTVVRGIDFVGLATSLGCAGVRVQEPGELAATLRHAIQSPVPILVDVVVA